MSASNGVIRIGRKGLRKFAFGEDGAPFDVDVVTAIHHWLAIDDSFRPPMPNEDGERNIPMERVPEYHQAAVGFVTGLSRQTHTTPGQQPPPVPNVTVAEALDFIARLREQYDELATFFRPKSREKPDSPDTSEAHSELRFTVEKGD